MLLAHPKEIPTDLIEALAREFAAVKSVRGAWLMLAMRAGRANRAGCSASITRARGRTCAMRSAARYQAISSTARMLDALPLEGSSLAATLRTGIPITAAKPGFLQKLFR